MSHCLVCTKPEHSGGGRLREVQQSEDLGSREVRGAHPRPGGESRRLDHTAPLADQRPVRAVFRLNVVKKGSNKGSMDTYRFKMVGTFTVDDMILIDICTNGFCTLFFESWNATWILGMFVALLGVSRYVITGIRWDNVSLVAHGGGSTTGHLTENSTLRNAMIFSSSIDLFEVWNPCPSIWGTFYMKCFEHVLTLALTP